MSLFTTIRRRLKERFKAGKENMERPDFSEITKIGIVTAILIILLGGFILLRIKRVQVLKPAAVVPASSNQMYFKPAKTESTVGTQFDVDIYFRAKDKILFGADAVVAFDPNYLEVSQVQPATFFQEYPRKKIDAVNGVVKITGYNPINNKPLSEDILFATLKVKAKKKGSVKLTFDYKAGSTNATTLVERGTSKNILAVVNQMNVEIK